MSWSLGTVSDIAEVISGYAFKSEWFGIGEDKVIRIGDLQNGSIRLDSALSVDAKSKNISDQFKIQPKDILMALSGATVGKIAVAQKQDAGAFINQRVAIVRGKTPEAADFLKYVFSGDLLEKLLLSAGGAAQPNLSSKSLALMEIPLPPLAEQKRIAAILDKADGIRRKRQQAIKLADEFLRSVFLEMFGDPVTNPKGWEILQAEKVLKIQGGYAFQSSNFLKTGIPVVKIGNANKEGFTAKNIDFVQPENKDKLKQYELRAGDLLMSLTGTVGKDDYGNITEVNNQYSMYYLNQRVARIDIYKDSISKNYLKFYLAHPKVKSEITKNNRGIRQANISNSDIYKLLIPIPTIDLQNRFEGIVSSTYRMIDKIKQQVPTGENLFQSLSKKAFSGNLQNG